MIKQNQLWVDGANTELFVNLSQCKQHSYFLNENCVGYLTGDGLLLSFLNGLFI